MLSAEDTWTRGKVDLYLISNQQNNNVNLRRLLEEMENISSNEIHLHAEPPDSHLPHRLALPSWCSVRLRIMRSLCIAYILSLSMSGYTLAVCRQRCTVL